MDAAAYPPAIAFEQPTRVPRALDTKNISIADLVASAVVVMVVAVAVKSYLTMSKNQPQKAAKPSIPKQILNRKRELPKTDRTISAPATVTLKDLGTVTLIPLPEFLSP